MQKKVISDRYREKETKFSDRLFVTKFNTPLNVQIFNEAIDRIVKEINLMKNELEQMEKFTGHSFRHTFATRCIESGIQPKTLQKYLGHATLQMTMDLYVHTTDEHKQEEMKKLESSLENLREDEQKFNEKFEKEMIEDNKIVTFASRMA
jgi:integrase